MHAKRIAGPTPPTHGTRAHDVERKLLLELVLAPPPFTDDLAELTERIGEPRADVEAALAALGRAGLAGRDGGVVWATAAARYSEALFPMCP
jgi:hypothetical protein